MTKNEEEALKNLGLNFEQGELTERMRQGAYYFIAKNYETGEESVTVVEIKGHEIKTVPRKLLTLTNLMKLRLINTGLQEVPYFLTNFKQLNTIWFKGNELSEINGVFKQLPSLKYLILSNNQLINFPQVPKGIEVIYLCNNQITSIPQYLLELSDLETICVKGNPLTPKSITLLEKLRNNDVDVTYEQ